MPALRGRMRIVQLPVAGRLLWQGRRARAAAGGCDPNPVPFGSQSSDKDVGTAHCASGIRSESNVGSAELAGHENVPVRSQRHGVSVIQAGAAEIGGPKPAPRRIEASDEGSAGAVESSTYVTEEVEQPDTLPAESVAVALKVLSKIDRDPGTGESMSPTPVPQRFP